MDFFDYIASNDPAAAADVIQSYGYDIQNQNLGECCRELVEKEGESGLRSLASIHPDRDLIVKYFGESETHNFCGADGSLSSEAVAVSIKEKQTQKIFGDNQTLVLTFILATSLLITAAIVTK